MDNVLVENDKYFFSFFFSLISSYSVYIPFMFLKCSLVEYLFFLSSPVGTIDIQVAFNTSVVDRPSNKKALTQK